jgi:hypothetical protein
MRYWDLCYSYAYVYMASAADTNKQGLAGARLPSIGKKTLI